MTDITADMLLRSLRGVQAVRAKATEALANGRPEAAFIPGVGLIVSAGNAGASIPLAFAVPLCEAMEAAIHAVAAEHGIGL